ncbi:outer membrane beta-barrel protein [Winogradskyella psychrotolerans]|uniref:outer membrane beta-barrel protein n=1 Tax=Winogradskyella psychrotolerans TaxID=1344585 RepID=UPI001C068920|nr:outer membrane beta-barrel protein [Winogradskyella psychrotolerans]MBU2927239.1 outer membrane beta-barrel protein [Winogradskyella psychrotolerans]
MKKLMLMAALAVFGFTNVNAQDDTSGGQTSEGKWLIEANTGNQMLGTTGLYFSSSDGSSSYNIGLDGGYFIMDDLAIKAGLGYGGYSPDEGDSTSAFSYRLGAKYYFNSMIPVTVDLTGASGDGAENYAGETPLWLGVGAGYAWFISDNVSIEPGLRYNVSLNEDYTDEGVLQFNVGFALHF